MAAHALKELLQKHSVADLPAPKKLIEVDSKAQLIDGFEVRFARVDFCPLPCHSARSPSL